VDIASEAPILGTPTVGFVYELIGSEIVTEAPVIGAPTVSQVSDLTSTDIVAGEPTVGPARFKWQVETVPAAVWTEQEAA
jgi:hypothetical protein